MKVKAVTIDDNGEKYNALMFICPGCALDGKTGLLVLPVNNGGTKSPDWFWDGNKLSPSLSPSIITKESEDSVCHSFLSNGAFIFLEDSTHALAGLEIPLPDLPEWAI